VTATWVRRVFDRLQDDRTCWLVLLAAMAAYGALALWITRGTTLFIDEVNTFTGDRGFDLDALLAPLNGHFVLSQRLIFATDFKVFGANFLVLRLVEVGGAALAVGLFFELARRRIGGAAALAPAVLLLFLGSAWELNFVVSGIGNVYAVVAGLGAFLALERQDRRGDVLACALLVVAIASFTLGLAFVVGAAVLVVLQGRSWRRLWIAAVPLALYAAWLIWIRAVYVPDHGEIQNFHIWNVLLIPNFLANEASTVAGALAGLNYNFQPRDILWLFGTDSLYGPLLAALATAALVIRLRRGPRPPALWALIAVLVAFWVSLAMGYDASIGRTPTTVRYVYAGAFMVLLVGAEAARGLRFRRGALVLLYAITALALGANLARLRDATHFYRSFATSLRAQLTAVDLARGRVDPTFVVQPPAVFSAPVKAGPYLAAAERAGSPGYSPAELTHQDEGTRATADRVLVEALRIAVAPARPHESVRNCRHLSGPGSALIVRVKPPGVRLGPSTAGVLALGRFATVAAVPVGSLQARRVVDLRIPADRSKRPWRAVVTPAPASLVVCDLSAG
jgi:hypothetical protein